MSVPVRRFRRGLKGSATEDWIAAALTKQKEPHVPEPGRHGACGACGLAPSAPVHHNHHPAGGAA